MTPTEAAALSGATAIIGFLLAFSWNRWWRKRDDDESSRKKAAQDHELSQNATLTAHGGRLSGLESRMDAVEVREDARQQSIGRLEHGQNALEGRVLGLQDFWKSEFNTLRRELREDQQRFEERIATMLQGHQQRVHDRLNVIAADQAKLLTDFVDRLVDKKAEAP